MGRAKKWWWRLLVVWSAIAIAMVALVWWVYYDDSYDKSKALLMSYISSHPEPEVRDGLQKLLASGEMGLVFDDRVKDVDVLASVYKDNSGKLVLSFYNFFLHHPWLTKPSPWSFSSSKRVHVVLLHEYVHILQARSGKFDTVYRFDQFWQNFQLLLPYLDDVELQEKLGLRSLGLILETIDLDKLEDNLRQIRKEVVSGRYLREVEAYSLECVLAERLGVVDAFDICEPHQEKTERAFREEIYKVLEKGVAENYLKEELRRVYERDIARFPR